MTTTNHEFQNSDPTKFDSNCSVCEGKKRDSIHYMNGEMTAIIDKLAESAATKVDWITTTEERYYEMLGVLPPAAMGNNAFQVGEPMGHRNGRPTFSSFKTENRAYFESSDALTFREFKAEFPEAVYHYQ